MRSLWRPQEGWGVTNDQDWQTPGGAAPDAAASPWATPGVSPSAAPPGASATNGWNAQAAPGAWTPPPKPGLIALHPLSFGTIIGSSFRVMRRNPAPTFGLSVLLNGTVALILGVVFAVFFVSVFTRFESAAIDDQADIAAGSFGLFFLLLIVPVALSIIASGILQGILSLEVSRATLGEKLRIRGLWRLAKGRIGTLILWALLTSAVLIAFVLIAGVIIIGITAAMIAFSPSESTAVLAGLVGVLFVFVIGLAVVVLSVWLGTKTALTPSAIVLERLGLFAAIARSWQLTRNSFWRTFGIQVLIAVVVNVATSVITYPIQFIGSIVITLINPTAEVDASVTALVILSVVSAVLSAVVGAIGVVMLSSSLALIYIDMRMRKEGLDLELLQYVEAKQNSLPGVENPYARLAGSRGTPTAPTVTGSPWA